MGQGILRVRGSPHSRGMGAVTCGPLKISYSATNRGYRNLGVHGSCFRARRDHVGGIDQDPEVVWRSSSGLCMLISQSGAISDGRRDMSVCRLSRLLRITEYDYNIVVSIFFSIFPI